MHRNMWKCSNTIFARVRLSARKVQVKWSAQNINMNNSEKYEIVSHQYGSLSLRNHRYMIEGETHLVSSIRLKSRVVCQEPFTGLFRYYVRYSLEKILKSVNHPAQEINRTGNDFLGIRDNNSILSIDLNQDEDEIIIERDSPGYSSFQCLSDIGTSLLWTIGM